MITLEYSAREVKIFNIDLSTSSDQSMSLKHFALSIYIYDIDVTPFRISFFIYRFLKFIDSVYSRVLGEIFISAASVFSVERKSSGLIDGRNGLLSEL